MSRYLTDLNALPEFFMFPKVLLSLDLTYTEAAVYMLLLDRSRISAVTEGWRDPLGRVFLYYTVRSLAVASSPLTELASKRELMAPPQRSLTQGILATLLT